MSPTASPAADRARRRAQEPQRDTTPRGSRVARFDPEAAKREIVGQLRAPQRVEQFASLLGGDERALERMLTVALHAATSNPRILQADPLTIVEAVRESMTLRLELTGVNGQGYLVPYWNKEKSLYDVQFQPGYRGLLLLVERTGKVVDVQAEVVYEADYLDWMGGARAYVNYRAAWADRGDRLGTLAWANLPSEGGLVTKVIQLPEADAERIRKSSKAADNGPWIEWPDEMRKKSALRRLTKILPQDESVERALALEARAEERYSLPPAGVAPRRIAGVGRAHAALGIPASTGGEPDPEPPAATERAPRSRRGQSALADDVVEGQVREDPAGEPVPAQEASAATAAEPEASAPAPAAQRPSTGVGSLQQLKDAFVAEGRELRLAEVKNTASRLFPDRDLELHTPVQMDRDGLLTAAEWDAVAAELGIAPAKEE